MLLGCTFFCIFERQEEQINTTHLTRRSYDQSFIHFVLIYSRAVYLVGELSGKNDTGIRQVIVNGSLLPNSFS